MKSIEELTPAAREAVRTQRLDGHWEPKKLLRLLDELQRWDTVVEAQKTSAAKVQKYSAIGIFAGIFGGGILSAIAESFALFALFAGTPTAILLLTLWRKKRLRSVDIPDEVRVTIEPLLRKLRADIAEGQRVRLRLDLSGVTGAKAKGKQQMPPSGRAFKIEQTLYDDPICDLRLPLADGAEAALRIDNTYLKIERAQRGRSKTKHKTKWKKQSSVTASWSPAAPVVWKTSALEASAVRGVERVQVREKEGIQIASIQHIYKFKAADSAPDAAPPAKEVLGMFMRLRLLGM